MLDVRYRARRQHPAQTQPSKEQDMNDKLDGLQTYLCDRAVDELTARFRWNDWNPDQTRMGGVFLAHGVQKAVESFSPHNAGHVPFSVFRSYMGTQGFQQKFKFAYEEVVSNALVKELNDRTDLDFSDTLGMFRAVKDSTVAKTYDMPWFKDMVTDAFIDYSKTVEFLTVKLNRSMKEKPAATVIRQKM
jgi:hypothetical protein